MMGNQLKERAEQIDVYNNFLGGLFNLILGQCTKLMKDNLHTRAEYDQINQTQNGIELLSLICTITHTYDEQQVKQVHVLDKYKEDYDALKWNKDNPLMISTRHLEFNSRYARMWVYRCMMTAY